MCLSAHHLYPRHDTVLGQPVRVAAAGPTLMVVGRHTSQSRVVRERWRSVGWQNNFGMDDTALFRVVVGHAVPLVHQLFTASIGGSGHSGFALAPLDYLNRTMKNCRKKHLLPATDIGPAGM